MNDRKCIGLIAGGGQFPIIFSDTARAQGIEVYAVAYFNETDPALEKHVDGIKWIHLGQVKRLLNFLKAKAVSETVMMGTIRKTRLFTDVKPDSKVISLVARMRSLHDDGLLRAFARLLEDEGIRVRSSTFLLPGLLAREGCWTKRKPSRSEREDIKMGWQLAKEIGRLDIGQCIVVGGGTVLAVEAIEGTDATILRGGRLGNGMAVVVKVCKPNQDVRFDIPATGVQTIKTMIDSGARALAIEAGKAVVFDREQMIKLANEHKISIVGITESSD